MYCPECGNEARGKFCTNCGTRLETPAAQGGQSRVETRDSNATASLSTEEIDALLKNESAGRGAGQTFIRPGAPPPKPPAQPPRIPRRPAEPALPAGHREEPSPVSEPSDGWDPRPQRTPEPEPLVVGTGGMSVGVLVSSTFQTLQARAVQFLGVAAAYTLAMFVAFFVFGLIIAAAGFSIGSGSIGGALAGALLGGLLIVAVGVVAGAVAGAAYINIAQGTEAMDRNDLAGSTLATLKRAWDECPNLLLALLALAGLSIGVGIVVAILGGILGLVSSALSLLVSLAAICVYVWMGVSFAFVPQAAVLDRATPVAALMESRNLVAGRFWQTLGYLFVGELCGMGLFIAGLIVVAILNVVLSHIPILGGLIESLLIASLLALFYVFYITYTTLMFDNLKARETEGVAEMALV